MTTPNARLVLILTMFLAMVSLVSAAPPSPEVFVQKVGEWIKADQLIKVAQAVRFYGEVGEKAFAQVMAQHKSDPTADSEEWLNAVARAFRLEGRDHLNKQLRRAKILWPLTRWEGTVFEADQMVDTRGTIAEKLPPKTNDNRDHFKEGLAATHLAVRVGNDKALGSMLKALNAHLKKNPNHPDAAQVMALEVAALEATGLWNEAIKLGRKYAPSLKGEPAVNAHLSMLSAARKLEKPSEVDRLLKETSKLLGTADNPSARFILESVALERRSQTERLSLTDITDAHVKTWRHLNPNRLSNVSGGLGRQIVEAAGIWVRLNVARMQQQTDEFPERAQSYYIVWEDLRRLRRLSKSQMAMRFQPSEAVTFLELWNPEFMLATQSLELEVVSAFRRRGNVKDAKILLGELEASIEKTYQTIKEAGLGYQLAHYGRPIALEGGQFEFSWTVGDAPRMVALQRIEKAHLDNDDLAVEEALVFQRDARSQGGFLGLEDARFLKVERMIAGKNPGAASSLNAELEKISAANDYRPGRIACLVNAAEIANRTGKKVEAKTKASKAVELIEVYLTEAGPRSAARQRFRRAYELLAELQLEAGENEKAFETLARLAQAESLMTLDVAKLSEKDPKLRSLVDEVKKTRTRGQALEQSRGNQASAGKATKLVDGEIAGNRSQFYKALGAIRKDYPRYGQMMAVRPVNFPRMQKFVPKDTVVVQVFPAKDALFLFVLTQKDLKIVKVPVSQRELTKLSVKARRGLLRSSGRSLNRAGRAFQTVDDKGAENMLQSFVELHKHLIDPIAKEIEPYKVVAFIPSGSLMDVPLQALARKKGESLEFLIERKQVVTLLKSSDLERLGRQTPSASGGSLVIGNPDGTLPGATVEANSIAATLKTKNVLIEDEATLAKVKNLRGISFLHLATHGILNREDPNLSYLVLGQGEKLDIGEIAGLDLSGLRMVTLSACETALGVDSSEQSELTTLADAFSFAGCPTVTASLWKVSDDSTKTLMENYYRELKSGSNPAAAMQAAQKTLISQKETAHPYHWAAFLLIGDWR